VRDERPIDDDDFDESIRQIQSISFFKMHSGRADRGRVARRMKSSIWPKLFPSCWHFEPDEAAGQIFSVPNGSRGVGPC
jgi:hypothetical protein